MTATLGELPKAHMDDHPWTPVCYLHLLLDVMELELIEMISGESFGAWIEMEVVN
jgi:hypothetical protein